MKVIAPLLVAHSASLLSAASRAMLDGKEHMVVPVIGIREGVLNGVFYSSDDLKANVAAWNGVPVPVNHPVNDKGDFITANSQDVEEQNNIGRFYNASFDPKSKALKGELWIDIEKAQLLGHKALIERLDKGEKVDVSTGLWTNAIPKRGIYNGRSYDSVPGEITPDHLAILPDSPGACSVNDGCGTFIHNCSCKPKKNESLFAQAFTAVKKVFGFQANELSHSDLRSRLSAALPEEGDKWKYIIDVYDKFFIYESGSQLFKQSYNLGEDDQVTLIGDPTEVVIERKYKEVNPKLSTNMKCPTNLALLASMLAVNSITKEQHDQLAAVPDEAFSALIPKGALATNAAAASTTPQAVVSPLSDDERELLANLKREREERITTLRNHVKSAYGSMDPAVVDTMNITQLEALAKAAPSGQGGVDYSLNAGGAGMVANTDQGHQPTPILLAAVNG